MEGSNRQGQLDCDSCDRPVYFRSIYFREPGGVLCELATEGPGFAVDEDIAALGERLSLPPFLEPQRPAIESQLRPITQIDLPTHV